MLNNVNDIEALICRLIDKLDDSKTDSLELEVGDVKIKLGKHKPPHHGHPHGDMPPMHMPAPQPPMMSQVQMSAPAVSEPIQTAVPTAAPVAKTATVNAPLLGVAYAASAPDAAPFVKVGDKVKKGDIICIIEAMKVMNEIESDKDGEIYEILFENGKMVEYGQPLISVR